MTVKPQPSRQKVGRLAVILILLLAPAAHAADKPVIASPEAIVIDAQTGDVAFAKDADARRPIASTTKLMTVLLTLEHGGLEDTVTAPRYRADSPLEILLGLRKGDQITEADLLRGALVISANDAAYTLADHIGGDVPTFVNEMNRRAQQLGLKNTHYGNPIGLDTGDNYSSARDLATLTRTLRKYRFFRRTVNTNELRLTTGPDRNLLTNRNTLLAEHGWIDGVKTGYTSQAGNVLVASGTKRNVHLISVVIGAASRTARNDESVKLLNYGFTKYRLARAVVAGARRTSVPIRNRPGATLPLIAETTVRKVKRVTERFTYKEELPKDVAGPIHYGKRIGTLVVELRGRKVAAVPLTAGLAIPRASTSRRIQDLLTGPWALLVLGVLLILAALLSQRGGGRSQSRRRLEESGAAE